MTGTETLREPEDRNQWSGILMTAGILLALGMTVAWLLTAVDRGRTAMAKAATLSYLPKGEYLKVAVLGYRQLAADLLWLQVVQHIGSRRQTPENYLWIYHATDTLTDLDPKFAYAYQAVGSVLGVWGNLPRESVALLQKGLAHNPSTWELAFLLGYVYFYELGDSSAAAVYLKMASQLPGSPQYLQGLTARMLVQTGDPQAALEFLERMYERSQDERARAALKKRIDDVLVEQDLRVLETAVRRYQAVRGRLPGRLQDLIATGMLARLPEDPGGGSYELNPSDGSVKSTRLHERMRVYRHN